MDGKSKWIHLSMVYCCFFFWVMTSIIVWHNVGLLTVHAHTYTLINKYIHTELKWSLIFHFKVECPPSHFHCTHREAKIQRYTKNIHISPFYMHTHIFTQSWNPVRYSHCRISINAWQRLPSPLPFTFIFCVGKKTQKYKL